MESPQIIDLNKGTTTDFASIVSPAATQQYGYFFPLGIADNGAILANTSPGGFGNDQYVVLTPPGVPVEVKGAGTDGIGHDCTGPGRHSRSAPSQEELSWPGHAGN